MKYAILAVLSARLFAARIPAGTEISIRLTEKVASELTTPQSVTAVVIAPVVTEGKIILPSGPTLSGSVKLAKAASQTNRAQLQLVFTKISDGKVSTGIAAIVSSLDNARESVDNEGIINGIDASQAYGTRLNQGIAKLESNEKFSALATILEGAKETLKIQDVNANIDYDAGTELTLKLSSDLTWNGITTGPEAQLKPFPDQNALPGLVERQPFRTFAQSPHKPSDMTNIMFIGTEEELQAAFEKAGWSSAARLNASSKLETARALIEDRGYKEGPVSVLFLDERPPDLVLQKGNNTFASRHHLRIFRRPDTFLGQPVWVCSSTQDTGISFSERDRTFIHKVDPQIDKERAKVVSDLLFTGTVRSVALVERPDVPRTFENATGDRIETDGRMAVLLIDHR